MHPILSLTLLVLLDTSTADYWTDRSEILANEASELPGSWFKLTENEQKVNDILMELKLKEYDEGFADPSKFLPSIHFFKSRELIEQSEVFKFIRKVPKGASLHSHSSAMLSSDALFNMTYMDGLFGCFNNGTFQLHFFFGSVDDERCEWKMLSQWRDEDSAFDDFLRNLMTVVVDDPFEIYSDINIIWEKFESVFRLISPLFKYRQFLHDYLYQMMQEFLDDNVVYLEFRSGLGETFDSEGNVYDNNQTFQLYLDTQLEFRQDNREFIGFRIIYAKSRQATTTSMEEHISEFLKLLEYDRAIGLLAGFDLVGQEDLGRPLSDFVEQLLPLSNLTNFYFHAGETTWYGVSDLNLVDAVLLNTTRIGHGFALTKHPEILKLIKEKNIAVELNPISNQVLRLVDDLRNHVGATLIANGYPVVVGCDDPSFWGAKGLSYDWYMTFMAMTPRSADLRFLKQLAFNSFIYSSLTDEDKPYALAILEGRWDDFVHEILKTYR